MDKFLIKRPMNSDESVIENKVNKVSETSSDVKTRRECLNQKPYKKDRKYQESYIKFGFTCDGEKGEPKCVICLERLALESMKPSKLKRHLVTKHPQFQHKDENFFKRYENSLEVQKNVLRNFTSVSKKALAASLEALYLIAKTKKPHSIGESLILPASIKIVSIMHGESYANELKTIPLSRDTVSRRIENMSDNIKSQLLNRLRGNYFAMQLDESTDITNLAQLLVYVRYSYKDKIEEDFLFCQ